MKNSNCFYTPQTAEEMSISNTQYEIKPNSSNLIPISWKSDIFLCKSVADTWTEKPLKNNQLVKTLRQRFSKYNWLVKQV